ncbi:TPA: preprotein translocase subunit SecY [Candidatus Berkelbacteria bacterium]|uniref:Protein translocase subunit SecY n=1 Tax=Berkelbacteria bacterium GW2011_GWE1_39_12 TaxID=1618337 RepID=A0A0G4B4J7_9BACT|nr:MAG: preprotein translocase subunit SecY, preprotein translocase subunit SecY [Berkelbacteria bacterium GW2011_GWE1_39_12]HBO60181.1 preprotein translocase subunit SecY [Candidatus Berkelbacteria bacterium]
MRIIETFQEIFTMKDLRNRILYAVGLLLAARILAHVPLPGVDLDALQSFFARNQIFGLFNMFSGGAMENFSVILMGVGPYITATIIFQLLTMIIPAMDELNKEGESGRAKINYWTRIATVPLALVQSFSMIRILQSQSILGSLEPLQWATILVSVTAGTILLMWLGELITENGIGNGVSLIIALGIISAIPGQVRNTLQLVDSGMIVGLIIYIAISIAVVVLIVLANEGTRQIPVSYARRIRGLKSYGGVDSFIPIRVNSAGVIPIIFAMSILLVPGVVANLLQNAKSEWLASSAAHMATFFQNNLYQGIIYFILVVAFTYFYTGIVLKPTDMAENLQKQGGFIPGIRPGTETSNYLSKVVLYITLSSAIFLGAIAVLPYIVQAITNINTLVLGGTGILIMVSVIIETMRQIQAQLAMRSYDKY